MRLYHATRAENASSIREQGFRDSTRFVGHYDDGRPCLLTAVWLSDAPIWNDCGANPPDGWVALAVDIPVAVIRGFEFTSEEKTYREWAVPSEIVNRYLEPRAAGG